MTGTVLEVDKNGDAYIKFWRDELDDEFIHHWVFKRTGWDNLELPGVGSSKMRATRTVTCLDGCTQKMQCIPYPEASKKKQKAYQKCIGTCKMDACEADEDCKKRLHSYGECKQRIGSSGLCAPLEEESREAEL